MLREAKRCGDNATKLRKRIVYFTDHEINFVPRRNLNAEEMLQERRNGDTVTRFYAICSCLIEYDFVLRYDCTFKENPNQSN